MNQYNVCNKHKLAYTYIIHGKFQPSPFWLVLVDFTQLKKQLKEYGEYLSYRTHLNMNVKCWLGIALNWWSISVAFYNMWVSLLSCPPAETRMISRDCSGPIWLRECTWTQLGVVLFLPSFGCHLSKTARVFSSTKFVTQTTNQPCHDCWTAPVMTPVQPLQTLFAVVCEAWVGFTWNKQNVL